MLASPSGRFNLLIYLFERFHTLGKCSIAVFTLGNPIMPKPGFHWLRVGEDRQDLSEQRRVSMKDAYGLYNGGAESKQQPYGYLSEFFLHAIAPGEA